MGAAPMTTRTIRRLWFTGLWLFLPWPLVVFSDALVPAIRYLLLGAVAATVAVAEGASGPVGGVVFLFLGMGIVTTLACWLAAWAIARVLGLLPPGSRRIVTWVCLVAALIWALAFDPYQTPFGRAPTGGLLDVLS